MNVSSTRSSTRPLGPGRVLHAGVVLLVGWAVLAAFGSTPAAAIPGDGSGPDTPGTSASVSPRSLRSGSVIQFSVSGFPAGEVLNVKIDDGSFCSQRGVHGACVVHQQRIGSTGSVSGSFVIPGDLPTGSHWLRFLASSEMRAVDGTYLGVKGFTRRGGADFQVVATSEVPGSPQSPAESSGTTGAPGTGAVSPGSTPGSTPGSSQGATPGSSDPGSTNGAPGGLDTHHTGSTSSTGLPSGAATDGESLEVRPAGRALIVKLSKKASAAARAEARSGTATQPDPTASDASTPVTSQVKAQSAPQVPWARDLAVRWWGLIGLALLLTLSVAVLRVDRISRG